jgi:hypothetical protein
MSGSVLALAALVALPLAAGSAWKSVRLEPGSIVLAHPGASQHFLVSGIDDEGETDVTAICRVLSSNPEVVDVDSKRGILTGKKPGEATVRVTLGSVSSAIKVTVGNRSGGEMSHPFSPDVISILTTKGCNGSGCHGSPAGQNGFKLSLFGYDTDADYRMIVAEHEGRRVDLSSPEKSLFLLKPTFAVPHGGGRLLQPDSEEYRTLLSWLKQGARLDSDGPRLTKLEMYPGERLLAGVGTSQRLAVIGRLSDGTTRDMTREVRYIPSDETVAAVNAEGVVTAAGRGLTTVMARAMGHVATAQFGVIVEKPGPDYPLSEANNFIDTHVFAKLHQLNVLPAPLSSDREFVRRVFLDVIGTLPAPEEVDAFLRDTGSDKRSRIIDGLLDRPEYASHWTVKFEDWFRNSQLHSQGRTMGAFKDWIRDWIAKDRPYDEVVRELLTSKGDTTINPAANFWHPATDFMLLKFDVNKVTPTVSRLFLGVRLECAECHNHPLENYTQDDFYGLAAFFARIHMKRGYVQYRRTWHVDDTSELLHPATKQPVKPKFLGGETPEIPPGTDRRAVLADWLVHDPNFARATVNRIWHEYFQTGIVEPFDDFRSTNAPTSRRLLNELAEHFANGGFRFKALHRLILNSRTYQLSSRGEGGNQHDGLERLLFARYLPRKLPAEVLLDAIARVTGISPSFRNYPAGTSAKDLYESPDYFLVTFGFPRRDILTERLKAPTLSQALHLMNGDAVRRMIEAPDNVMGEMLQRGKSDDAIVSAIYHRAYSRPPSDKQTAVALNYLASEQRSGRSRQRALENFLWGVLNSKEFQLNH